MKQGKCYIIAEIGINHNGDLSLAKRLINAAKAAGADAVKFQKRTVGIVYSLEELSQKRESPFGTTNGALKHGLELSFSDYRAIDVHCKQLDLDWFASVWDEDSVDFIDQFNPPFHKIASASLTDSSLLTWVRSKGRHVFLSTGMSTYDEIDKAVDILGVNTTLMHTVSVYPAKPAQLNLRVMDELRNRYKLPVGYSGHEVCIAASLAAVVLGAVCIERHLTLTRSLWGSDQSASLEPHQFEKMVRDIRLVEQALGDGTKRIDAEEIPVMHKLRRVGRA